MDDGNVPILVEKCMAEIEKRGLYNNCDDDE
jgi:hypothetical protein